MYTSKIYCSSSEVKYLTLNVYKTKILFEYAIFYNRFKVILIRFNDYTLYLLVKLLE